jgi:hypothetical protein
VYFAGTCSHNKLKFLAQSCTRRIYQIDKACNAAFAHLLTHSALEASTFQSLHTRFAHQLIARTSVEQNSIGHTQIIISQDFKWIPEGLA